MNKIDTVLVAFSATSIHKKLVIRALDVAEKNNAKLMILSVRDKNIAERVAKMTKDHGFLGRKVVEKLKEDIIKDRNEVILKRLSIIEKEAENRGIVIEIIQSKGYFIEEVLKIVDKYNIVTILVGEETKKLSELKKNVANYVNIEGVIR